MALKSQLPLLTFAARYNAVMFFRRERARDLTFQDRLQQASEAGFKVEAGNHTRVSRNGCAAVLHDVPGDRPDVEKAGILIGDEIGKLVDGGFQKFFLTPSGRKLPALASHLKALHEFQEDLREALGLESLYNESLGTINDSHMYDRVANRDRGVARRPWER